MIIVFKNGHSHKAIKKAFILKSERPAQVTITNHGGKSFHRFTVAITYFLIKPI